MTNEQQLVAAALAARQHAYAPYSGFLVGAAVRTEDGQIFAGCNVENVSLGLTNCAERTALFAAVATGRQRFVALAVASTGAVTPCGACRQVLAEFCDDLPVLLVDADNPDATLRLTLAELLPARFSGAPG